MVPFVQTQSSCRVPTTVVSHAAHSKWIRMTPTSKMTSLVVKTIAWALTVGCMSAPQRAGVGASWVADAEAEAEAMVDSLILDP